MNTKELGNLGEKIACEYLVEKGFKILGKNYTVPTGRPGIIWGEIDIIAKKKWNLFRKNDKTIHFIEVKTLESKNPQSIFPEEHVDYKKQRKLRQMSKIWLEKHKFRQNYPYQIDVIGILVNKETRNAKLNYFENAVSEV